MYVDNKLDMCLIHCIQYIVYATNVFTSIPAAKRAEAVDWVDVICNWNAEPRGNLQKKAGRVL